MSAPFPDELRKLWATLTARQVEVAHCVARGKRNQEIASELIISLNTVETHLQHIYSKLNVGSRAQLIHLMRELDI